MLISFAPRPAMSRSDMRDWISERPQPRSPAIRVGLIDDAKQGPQVLRVEARGNWTDAAEEQLADLLMDMRLLGMRPTLMTAHSRGEGDGRTR
jgi:hypothetical protein